MTDDRNASSKAAVAVWAREGCTWIIRVQTTLFALTALLLLLENLVTFMSSHSFFYLGSPGISVLGNLFPGFRSNVASIQSNFERILVTLFWSTTGALAMTQFSKEYSLRQAIVRQAIVRHTSYMTNPPQLCFH